MKTFQMSFDDESKIPEDVRELAQKGEDGKFTVTLPVVQPEKVSEFRDTNINRGKELDELRKKMEELESKARRGDAFDQIQQRLAELEKGREDARKKTLLEQGKIDELLKLEREEAQARVQAVVAERDEMKKRLEAASGDLGQLRVEVGRRSLMDTLMGVIGQKELQVRRGAMTTLRLHAEHDWEIGPDGKAVCKLKDATSGEPLSPSAWVDRQVAEASFLFAEAQGGGATGGGSAGGGGGARITGKPDPLTLGQQWQDYATGKRKAAKQKVE